jgi:hypothetical protein
VVNKEKHLHPVPTYINTERIPSFQMLCHVALSRPDVSEECIASIITVTRIDELGIKSWNVGSNKSHTA